MKAFFSFAIAMIMASAATAQTVDYKNIYSQNAELTKLSKEARTEKATKDAKKEAKRMEKEGWKPMPGKLPIARQLDRVYNYQYELDEKGSVKYIYGTGTATANTVGAAQITANTQAREQIASNMGTSVTSLIDNAVKNQQISTSEAATLHETADKSKQIFSQNLGQSTPVLEIYRELPNGNAQVQVGTIYSNAEAQRVIRETMKKEMGDVDSKIF